MGSQTRSSRHTYGNIHDVDPPGYAEAWTPRTSTSHLWLPQRTAKTEAIFDPQHLELDERSFTTYDWYDFYRDAKEPLAGDMPTPRGQIVSTHCFVDSDHAANTVTRR